MEGQSTFLRAQWRASVPGGPRGSAAQCTPIPACHGRPAAAPCPEGPLGGSLGYCTDHIGFGCRATCPASPPASPPPLQMRPLCFRPPGLCPGRLSCALLPAAHPEQAQRSWGRLRAPALLPPRPQGLLRPEAGGPGPRSRLLHLGTWQCPEHKGAYRTRWVDAQGTCPW